MGKILGYKKFKSKAGADCCIVDIVVSPSARDKKFGYVGERCIEKFIPDEYHSLFNPGVIGKNIEISNDSITNEISRIDIK